MKQKAIYILLFSLLTILNNKLFSQDIYSTNFSQWVEAGIVNATPFITVHFIIAKAAPNQNDQDYRILFDNTSSDLIQVKGILVATLICGNEVSKEFDTRLFPHQNRQEYKTVDERNDRNQYQKCRGTLLDSIVGFSEYNRIKSVAYRNLTYTIVKDQTTANSNNSSNSNTPNRQAAQPQTTNNYNQQLYKQENDKTIAIMKQGAETQKMIDDIFATWQANSKAKWIAKNSATKTIVSDEALEGLSVDELFKLHDQIQKNSTNDNYSDIDIDHESEQKCYRKVEQIYFSHKLEIDDNVRKNLLNLAADHEQEAIFGGALGSSVSPIDNHKSALIIYLLLDEKYNRYAGEVANMYAKLGENQKAFDFSLKAIDEYKNVTVKPHNYPYWLSNIADFYLGIKEEIPNHSVKITPVEYGIPKNYNAAIEYYQKALEAFDSQPTNTYYPKELSIKKKGIADCIKYAEKNLKTK